MGLVDVAHWQEHDPEVVASRFPPRGGGALRAGSQLLVKQGQAAVFLRDGRAVEVFQAGRHTLMTANVPLFQEALRSLTGGVDLFSAEVVFVSQRLLPPFPWGSPCPFPTKDRSLGWVQVQASGTCHARIADPLVFVSTLMGGADTYTLPMLIRVMQGCVRQRLSDLVASGIQAVEDMPASTDELAAGAKVSARDDFRRYGLELVDLYVTQAGATSQVRMSLQDRARMEAVGLSSGIAQAARNLSTSPLGSLNLCTRCLKPLLPEARYCAGCGGPARTCPHCKSAACRAGRFCMECGGAL